MEENRNTNNGYSIPDLPTYHARNPQGDPRPSYQGGYTYQNPNPYQTPTAPPPPPKKKSKTALIIIASIAAGLMSFCALLFLLSPYIEFKDFPIDIEGLLVTDDEAEESASSERPNDEVYDVPEMVTSPKGETPLSLVEINKKVKDSVVAVKITMNGTTDFSGTGFIISADGYIITNAHVIEGAKAVEVVLSDGETGFGAVVVGSDSHSDVAVLKIEATDLKPVELGDSDLLEVGETVVAIGNPYGMELAGTVTNGIVSALNRKIEIQGTYMTLIQTNATINPGNSGGPLVNEYGQVVGITSSKMVAEGFEGIGFAIPINNAVEITEELITYGVIRDRAYIGVSGRDITEAEATQSNVPQGVLVVSVESDSDAAKKGLRANDIIIGFNGEEISSMADLNEKKDQFKPGDTVSITYWRNGREHTIKITLADAFE